jgi:type IV secretion system protein TrbL
MSPLRQAAANLRETFASGERAVMANGARGAQVASGDAGATNNSPAWAQRMKRSQSMNQGANAASHAVRSGDHPSGGHSVDLSEGE